MALTIYILGIITSLLSKVKYITIDSSGASQLTAGAPLSAAVPFWDNLMHQHKWRIQCQMLKIRYFVQTFANLQQYFRIRPHGLCECSESIISDAILSRRVRRSVLIKFRERQQLQLCEISTIRASVNPSFVPSRCVASHRVRSRLAAPREATTPGGRRSGCVGIPLTVVTRTEMSTPCVIAVTAALMQFTRGALRKHSQTWRGECEKIMKWSH